MKKEFPENNPNVEINSCRICNKEQCRCSLLNVSTGNSISTKSLPTPLMQHANDNHLTFKKPVVPVGCRLCNETCYRPTDYDKHWEIFHQNINRVEMYDTPHQCKVCDRYFQTKHSVTVHRSLAHSNRSKKIRNPWPSLSASSNENKELKHCYICGLNIDGFRTLRKHLKKIHGFSGVQSKDIVGSQPRQPSHNNTVDINLQSPMKNIASNCQQPLWSVRKAFHCANCGLICVDEESLLKHAFTSTCGDKENGAPVTSISVLPSSEHKQSVVVVKVLQPFKIVALQPCDFNELHVLSTITADVGKESSITVSLNQDSLQPSESSVEYSVSDVKQTESPYFIDTQCTICGEIADNAKSLKNHFIVYHGFEGCSICDFASRPADLEDHMKIAHSSESKILQNVEEEIEKVPPVKRKKPNSIKCRICGIVCFSQTFYKRHFNRYHPEYSLDDMFDNGWKCHQCSNVFQSFRGLQKHWSKKHNDLYGKVKLSEFDERASIEVNFETIPFTSEETSFTDDTLAQGTSANICHYCNRQCADKEQLAFHIALVHSIANRVCTAAIETVTLP